MRKSDIDNAVNTAHARITDYLAGASQSGEVTPQKLGDIVDRAFTELRQTLDAAAGLPPQR